jgi:hypothetical protein
MLFTPNDVMAQYGVLSVSLLFTQETNKRIPIYANIDFKVFEVIQMYVVYETNEVI